MGVEVKVPTMLSNTLRLLATARRHGNQSVSDAREVDRWHKEVDALLAGTPFDEPSERWDAPSRMKHRQFVNSLFDPKRRKRHD
jgi:hypothetical protein